MPTIILFRSGYWPVDQQVHLFLRSFNTSLCGSVPISAVDVPNPANTQDVCIRCMVGTRKIIGRNVRQ